jgi:uncharacterized protein
VKSFGGERVRRAFVGPFGLIGDRRHAVEDDDGTPLSARRAHALLGYAARYADGEAAEGAGVTTPSGLELDPDDPALGRELSELVGRPVRVVRSAVGVHDAAPLHLVSTSSLAAVGEWLAGEEVDRRRFRANLVIELDDPEPFAEMGWVGAVLELGDGGPVIEVVSPTERCAVTTFDPDTLERDNRILAGLARERENLFGVYARVRRPGWAEVGAPVRRPLRAGPTA